MITIGVCDDEPYMADLLAEKVSAFFEEKKVAADVFAFSSGRALLKSEQKLDILFLDIQMDAPNGFETAKELRKRGFQGFLLFVTALEEYVFDSFAVQAFDYLVKPLEEERFLRVMERLFSSMTKAGGDRLLVQRRNEWSMVPFNQIVYCEVINRKVYLHLKNAQVLDYYEKIEVLERKLDNRFFQCHRSYLINLQYLKSYRNGRALLENGDEIPVSRLRGQAFSQAVLEYMKERRRGQ